MKKNIKIFLIVLFILIDLILIYSAFIIGKNINNKETITINEANCLFNKYEEKISISEEQAVCLINNNEVPKFHGIGSPFYPPEVIRLEMESGKILIVEGNVTEMTRRFIELGASASSK